MLRIGLASEYRSRSLYVDDNIDQYVQEDGNSGRYKRGYHYLSCISIKL